MIVLSGDFRGRRGGRGGDGGDDGDGDVGSDALGVPVGAIVTSSSCGGSENICGFTIIGETRRGFGMRLLGNWVYGLIFILPLCMI